MMEKLNAANLIKLLLEHRDGIFGFILALTHDREAAEEVFQVVGLAVVEEANQGAEVTHFLPWVHELARRRVAEHFRKSARWKSMARADSMDEAVGQAFEENAADSETILLRQEHLTRCLEELPPAQRQMIEQRYQDKATIRSIAEALDWTDGAVKVALWKVRRRLAGCIDDRMAPSRGEE